MRRGLVPIVVALICGFGASQVARAAYIYSKARLAQVLIKRAWASTSRKGESARPWPWADTTPVARLGAPSQGVDLVILEGASGATLSFGPGHVSGTALPGGRGNSVIGGHRDTHFRFLKDLKVGEELRVEGAKGEIEHYSVVSASVVDQHRTDLLGDFGDDRLTLITCYPFDAIRPGGPLRYVVTAIRSASASRERSFDSGRHGRL